MAEKPKHWRASKAMLSEPNYFIEKNILTPFRVGRIITENGEIWEAKVSAFNSSEELLLLVWDQKPEEFTKVELNT